MITEPWSEKDLQELYNLLPRIGGYFHTYPNTGSDYDVAHEGFLGLECRGLVVRHIDESNHICWKAKKESTLDR